MARAWKKAEMHQALQSLIEAAYAGKATRPIFGIPARPGDPDVVILDVIEELEDWRRQQRCLETAEQALSRLNQYYGGRAAAAQRAASDMALYWQIKQETIQHVAKNMNITLRERNQSQKGEPL